nr:TPA_asm: m42 iORF [Murid betaherpesvirus 1]DBA07974.1 TPA_asm: m42 iORF [Murid betaherpesvirus 1]
MKLCFSTTLPPRDWWSRICGSRRTTIPHRPTRVSLVTTTSGERETTAVSAPRYAERTPSPSPYPRQPPPPPRPRRRWLRVRSRQTAREQRARG